MNFLQPFFQISHIPQEICFSYGGLLKVWSSASHISLPIDSIVEVYIVNSYCARLYESKNRGTSLSQFLNCYEYSIPNVHVNKE